MLLVCIKWLRPTLVTFIFEIVSQHSDISKERLYLAIWNLFRIVNLNCFACLCLLHSSMTRLQSLTKLLNLKFIEFSEKFITWYK